MVYRESVRKLTRESQIAQYLESNKDTLAGTTVDLDAFNPYVINYDGNNATAGVMPANSLTRMNNDNDSNGLSTAYLN